MSRIFVPPLAESPMTSNEDLYQYAHLDKHDTSVDDFKGLAPNRASDASSSDLEYGLISQSSAIQTGAIGNVSCSISEEHSEAGHKEKNDDNSIYRKSLRMFLFVAIFSAVLVMVIEALIYVAINLKRNEFKIDEKYIEMSIFLALFIFASIYLVVITMVGLHTKNMIILTMLCVFYACMLVYTGIQFREISLSKSSLEVPALFTKLVLAANILTIVILALTFVIETLLVIKFKSTVQWYKFKKIGANIEIKRLYAVFQIHRSLLMFDFFFFLAFTIEFILVMVHDETSLEFILTCCMLPLTIVLLFASDYAATRELLWVSLFTLFCFVGGCVYVMFKTIRLFTKYTSAFGLAIDRGSYFPGRTSLVTFGVITFLFLLATIIAEAFTIYNYRRGLLPFVNTYYSKLALPGRQQSSDSHTGNRTEKASNTEMMYID